MLDAMVIIVTGANRGIGLEICKQILNLNHKTPLKLYAASRGGSDLHLPQTGASEIHYPKLDITSQASISSLAEQVRKHDGTVDVLINNAGVNTSPVHDAASAKLTLDTNFRGTAHMCLAFLPLMTPGAGRIVNLSSVGSSLRIYSETIRERFRDPQMTLEKLEDLAREYEGVVAGGKETQMGFGGKGQAYSVSKACVNALTAVLAREGESRGIKVNCCCPGWVDTDMGGLVGKPTKTVADGAKIPIHLAFGDIGDTTGRYWANPSISDKGTGQVQEW